jgi:hypothetical protein
LTLFSPANLKSLRLKLTVSSAEHKVTCMFCREGFASVKTVTSINDIPADVGFYCLICLENAILPPYKLTGATIEYVKTKREENEAKQ